MEPEVGYRVRLGFHTLLDQCISRADRQLTLSIRDVLPEIRVSQIQPVSTLPYPWYRLNLNVLFLFRQEHLINPEERFLGNVMPSELPLPGFILHPDYFAALQPVVRPRKSSDLAWF